MVSTACNLEQVELGSGRMGNGTGGVVNACWVGVYWSSLFPIPFGRTIQYFFLPWTNL